MIIMMMMVAVMVVFAGGSYVVGGGDGCRNCVGGCSIVYSRGMDFGGDVASDSAAGCIGSSAGYCVGDMVVVFTSYRGSDVDGCVTVWLKYS